MSQRETPSLEDVLHTLEGLGDNGALPPDQQMQLDRALADLATLLTGYAHQEPPAPEGDFRALADNAPDLIVRFDREQRYVYVNKAVEELTGRPPEVFLGKRNRELDVPADTQTLWDREVGAVLATGERRRFQFAVAKPECMTYHEAHLVPEFAPDGSVDSVLASVRDVTDREQMQDILRQYATRLEFLQRAGDAMRAAYTADEVAAAILPFIVESVPCRRATVARYDWTEGEALLLAVEAAGETRLSQGQRFDLEWSWFLDQLGEGRPASVDLAVLESPPDVLQALHDEGVEQLTSWPLIARGELLGSLNLGLAAADSLSTEGEALAREMAGQLAIAIDKALLYEELAHEADTLERSLKRRTSALHRSHARFRAIFESTAVGMAVVDMDGRVLESNPALQQLLGYDARELEGMHVARFIHPDDIEARDRLFQELLAGERNHFQMEKRYVRKDGTTVWVRPTVSLIQAPLQPQRYAIKMVEDVTRRREARQALAHAERLQMAGRLGASLAHEINNPLMSIITSLGLAEEMLEPESDVRPYITIAVEELERAAAIVARLRDLGRKREPEEAEPTQLNELVSRVLALTARQADYKHVEVHWQPCNDLPPIPLVPDDVHQVLLNLVLNALDAMPRGGQLTVHTGRVQAPAGVHVTVVDTGRGIAPEELEHLFEPFHSTRPEGLGLGLYVSKAIVEEHGGQIEVESTPGQGSTFRIWLPLERDEQAENGERTSAGG